MTWLNAFPVSFLAFTSLVALLTAIPIWRHRRVPGAIYLFILMVALSWWAATNAIEFALIDIPTKIIFTKLSYLSIPFVAPLWFLFVMRYTQLDRWMTPLRVSLIWIIPFLNMALAVTNEFHGFAWPQIFPVSPEPGAMLVYTHGPGIWLDAAYSYLLLLAATIQLIGTILRSNRLYSRQALFIILTALFPWVGNILYITDLTPLRDIDFTPFFFTISGLIITLNIFRFQLLSLAPVAHHTLFDKMESGVIVIDYKDHIIDINPAAKLFLGIGSSDLGRRLDSLETVTFKKLWDMLKESATPSDALYVPDSEKWLSVKVSMLRNRGWNAGRLITLQDITDRKRLEKEREEMIESLEKALAEIKTLRGFIPICCHCKKIRTDEGFWQQIEKYISEHSEVVFSHGICPDCMEKFYSHLKKK